LNKTAIFFHFPKNYGQILMYVSLQLSQTKEIWDSGAETGAMRDRTSSNADSNGMARLRDAVQRIRRQTNSGALAPTAARHVNDCRGLDSHRVATTTTAPSARLLDLQKNRYEADRASSRQKQTG
jgi:hypothetical protein